MKVENMAVEKIRAFFRRVASKSPLETNQKCIGFYSQDGSFGFTTYGTEIDKERIIRDLGRSGASIVGIMDDKRARMLAANSQPTEHPRRF